MLYDYRSLSSLFSSAGFDVRLLEHYDEERIFHMNDWDPKDGFVARSKRYDGTIGIP